MSSKEVIARVWLLEVEINISFSSSLSRWQHEWRKTSRTPEIPSNILYHISSLCTLFDLWLILTVLLEAFENFSNSCGCHRNIGLPRMIKKISQFKFHFYQHFTCHGRQTFVCKQSEIKLILMSLSSINIALTTTNIEIQISINTRK